MIPIYDDTAPIACTLGSNEIPDRIAQLERLREEVMLLERTEHGLALQFPARPATEAEVRAFAIDEKACCAFWGFEVGRSDDTLTLRWDGPPTVAEFFDRIVAFFEGDAPLSASDVLL